MKLIAISINNFKGIESLALKFDGKNTVIRGKNGTGKTTIADAYCWACFGKAFDGKSIEAQIKKRGTAGDTPNDGGILHTVEVSFELDDGRPFIIRREYTEKWQKRRGTAQAEYVGDTTKYFIDDVPAQAGEFKKTVEATVCTEAAFKMLSMPLYFCGGLKWEQRRDILMKMCGDISDADVIASKAELSPLAELMQDKNITDFRKLVKSKLTKTNDEIKSIPARIDELNNAISGTKGLAKEAVQAEIESLKKQLSGKEKELQKLDNGSAISAKTNELATLESKMQAMRIQYEAKLKAHQTGIDAKIRMYEAEIEAGKAKIKDLEKEAAKAKNEAENHDKDCKALRDEWFKVNAEKFTAEPISDTCPTCGQPMPADKVQELEEAQHKKFNLDKAERLQAIQQEGKHEAAQGRTAAEMAENIHREIERKEEAIKSRTDTLDKLRRSASLCAPQAVEQSSKYISLSKNKKRLETEIEDIKAGGQSERRQVEQDIFLLKQDVDARVRKIAEIDQSAGILKRIDELKQKEKDLGGVYAELEHQLFLTEEFLRVKVAATEDKINSRFKYTKFKMFNRRKNGGLEECCEALIDGVPFNDGLNKGSRMKAAADVLNALTKYYKLSLPVFIDDCESYTSLIPIDSQLIQLVADKNYDELSMEVEK